MSTSEKCYEEKWNRVRSIENDRGVCALFDLTEHSVEYVALQKVA